MRREGTEREWKVRQGVNVKRENKLAVFFISFISILPFQATSSLTLMSLATNSSRTTSSALGLCRLTHTDNPIACLRFIRLTGLHTQVGLTVVGRSVSGGRRARANAFMQDAIRPVKAARVQCGLAYTGGLTLKSNKTIDVTAAQI